MPRMFIVRIPTGATTGRCNFGPAATLEFTLEGRPGELWTRSSGDADAPWERRRICPGSLTEGEMTLVRCYPDCLPG